MVEGKESGVNKTNQEAIIIALLKDPDGLNSINTSTEPWASALTEPLNHLRCFLRIFFNHTEPCIPDSGTGKIGIVPLSGLYLTVILLITMRRKFQNTEKQELVRGIFCPVILCPRIC